MMTVDLKLKRSLLHDLYFNVLFVQIVNKVLVLDINNPTYFTRVRISINNIEKMEISYELE